MMRSHKRSERGAAMVELAIVLPLFILLLFGIMEAGWAFSQQVEVRNAAREGARLAVVDYADTATMRAEVCARAPLSSDRAQVGFDLKTDTAEIRVEQDYQSLTGIVPSFDGITIGATVEMRLERPITKWVTTAPTGCNV